MPSQTHQSRDETRQPLLAEYQDVPGDADATPVSVDQRLQGTFTPRLGALEAYGILISIVIGSGVFTSPGAIDTNVPSPGIALVMWLLGGILAWTGASTLAELGTAIPGEGGVQPYLQYIFGDVVGFLAAWTWIVAVMPATLAILSIVFVESIYSAAGVSDQAASLRHKLWSILILALVSLANCISTKVTTRMSSFFVATKFIAILAVVAAGIAVVISQVSSSHRDIGGRDWFVRPWFGYRKTVNPDGNEIDWSIISNWELIGHLAAALYGALWAYSGWDKAIYISAELKSPEKQLPLAINTAIPTIIGCFIAANVAYYLLLPWDLVATTDSVAVTSITRLLGPAFGIIAAITICLVIAGSLLGNSLVVSRMIVAASNKNWFPRLFTITGRVGLKPKDGRTESDARENARFRLDAPINAIILSIILASLYILLGNFRALLTFNGLGEYTFFFLTVVGAIMLRFRDPALPRPYKPLVLIPVIFALVSAFVIVRGAVFAPVSAGVLVILWLFGLAYYWGRRRWIGSAE